MILPCKDCLLVTNCSSICDKVVEFNGNETIEFLIKDKQCIFCGSEGNVHICQWSRNANDHDYTCDHCRNSFCLIEVNKTDLIYNVKFFSKFDFEGFSLEQTLTINNVHKDFKYLKMSFKEFSEYIINKIKHRRDRSIKSIKTMTNRLEIFDRFINL